MIGSLSFLSTSAATWLAGNRYWDAQNTPRPAIFMLSVTVAKWRELFLPTREDHTCASPRTIGWCLRAYWYIHFFLTDTILCDMCNSAWTGCRVIVQRYYTKKFGSLLLFAIHRDSQLRQTTGGCRRMTRLRIQLDLKISNRILRLYLERIMKGLWKVYSYFHIRTEKNQRQCRIHCHCTQGICWSNRILNLVIRWDPCMADRDSSSIVS